MVLDLRHADEGQCEPNRETEVRCVATKRSTRYIRGRVLGKGATSTVYHAVDNNNGTEAAIKQFDPTMRSFFETELEVLGHLHHPTIARLLAFSRTQAALALEYVDGVSMDTLIPEHEPEQNSVSVYLFNRLPLFRALLSAAEGVGYMHQRRLHHLDVKPANIIVTAESSGLPDGKLVDMSTARSADTTADGASCGTPTFMSPEQAYGRRTSRRSDVFGLAASLYAVLTNRPPYSGTPMEATLQAGHADFRPVQDIVPFVPPRLADVCATGMHKDPRMRFPSAEVFHQQLSQALGVSGRQRSA